MTKLETSKLEEKPDLKLVRALQKDFKALYNPQYTANHKVKQMLINLEISIMRLDNIESLINKQRQEAVEEYRQKLNKYKPQSLKDLESQGLLGYISAKKKEYLIAELKELESKEESNG